eukprot:TRINITY_DN32266_c0_g1_i2.p1 TRINITY_DN32266_c0_g1~~TRINITY_DN32266_c0_g1_i2.p1  ORF type:complete len:513 (-),score=72.57 TRINITY_DN32266_c0_g1_i2:95-1633(-)
MLVTQMVNKSFQPIIAAEVADRPVMAAPLCSKTEGIRSAANGSENVSTHRHGPDVSKLAEFNVLSSTRPVNLSNHVEPVPSLVVPFGYGNASDEMTTRCPPLHLQHSGCSLGSESNGSMKSTGRHKLHDVLSSNASTGFGSDLDDDVAENQNTKEVSSHRCFEIIEDDEFIERYDLGDEVMPSGHDDTMVNFAVRKRDGFVVVVKRRFKSAHRGHKKGDRDWRQSMEFVLNMPKSEGIAKLFEVLESSTTYYVVTELVEGVDLFEMTRDKDDVPVGIVREILYQLLLAVDELHMNGALHRDLKLENVVAHIEAFKSMADSETFSMHGHSDLVSVSRDLPRSLKLIDFDTVTVHGRRSEKTKNVVGTDQYIAPEAYGGKYSPSSDMFSVGVIAYRLLTGKFPLRKKMVESKPGENQVGSRRMRQVRRNVQNETIRWNFDVFEEHSAARELVQSLLNHDEAMRPMAKVALAHRWFTGAKAPSPVVIRSSSSISSIGSRLTRVRSWIGNCAVSSL